MLLCYVGCGKLILNLAKTAYKRLIFLCNGVVFGLGRICKDLDGLEYIPSGLIQDRHTRTVGKNLMVNMGGQIQQGRVFLNFKIWLGAEYICFMELETGVFGNAGLEDSIELGRIIVGIGLGSSSDTYFTNFTEMDAYAEQLFNPI